MARLACSALVVLSLCGCAGPQLRESAVDMGPAFGSLQERQILNNLSSLIRKPWTIPGQIDVTTGSLQVQNQASLGWKVPISSTGHEADPSAQSQEQDSFTFTPVTDGDDLRRVRALYRYAICADPKEFARDWEETIKPYEQALLKTSLIAAQPYDEAEVRRLDDRGKVIAGELAVQSYVRDQAEANLHSAQIQSSPPGQQSAQLAAAQKQKDAAEQSLKTLKKQQASNDAKKKEAQKRGGAKDTTSKGSSDQNGPPDSVQLERARESMIVMSLGKERFLYWTDDGSTTSRFLACSGQTPVETSPPDVRHAYHLGAYGGLDLWTDQPDKFSKFMMLVIGSTPNTTGIHALTLGIPGNAPPKVQNSTPTLRILGGVL